MNIFKSANLFIAAGFASLLFMPVDIHCQNNLMNQLVNSSQDQKVNAASRPIDDPDISTFKTAVLAAGLEDVFIGTGPFTVFAPTNAAFEKLGKKKLEELLKPENRDQLSIIIEYHVVPGKYLAHNLKTATLRTIEGKSVDVKVDNGQITVNNAKVVKTDLVGPNGVIQEIDTVLMP